MPPQLLPTPMKTREFANHHFDSTVWNAMTFRDDDIIVASYAKSGTTWTQQIIGQFIFEGDPNVQLSQVSPWVDLRVPPKDVKLAAIEAQTHRRFLKTHLPVDALRMSPKAKYLYVARDGRDVLWSMHNHHMSANDTWYGIMNDTPGRVGPPIDKPNPDVRAYFHDWLDKDGHPFWPLWDSVRSWWAIRDRPNVKLIHYADLKADLDGQMRAIASYLDFAIAEDRWPTIVRHCTFEHMRVNASKVAPLGGAVFDGGGERFIFKGTNGRWRDVLTADDIARYEARALAELGPECAHWLANGSRG